MLASPIIEGTLPAFYLDDDGTATIAVPFFMSRAVNENEVRGFRLKIKNIQGSTYLVTLDHFAVDFTESIAYFSIPKATLNKSFLIGQFYKAQLAYVDLNGATGYYSTVGIIKYTTKPRLTILGLKESFNNPHIYSYTGVYSQYKQDTTEKVYSYRFVIKDDRDNTIKDSGFLIHSNSNDENHYESQDSFSFTSDLEANKKYTITYSVKTNNNLEVSSPPYKLIQKKSVISDLKAELCTSLNYDNGYIEVWLEGEKDDYGFEIPVRGSFVLSRSSELSNYMDWEQIVEFTLTSQKPSSKRWKDFTIEQGLHYKYSVQQYNSNLFSDRIITNQPIYADFEDIFLYDGKRQLKIRFNPKVSSFKKDLLEAKVDTLGSKYPFIFKNGQVEYKEFPISGLISYLMDEQGLFLNNNVKSFKEIERLENKKYVRQSFNALSDIQAMNKYLKDYMFYYLFENNQYHRWVHYVKEKYPSLQPDNWNSISDLVNKVKDRFYLIERKATNPLNSIQSTSIDENSNNIYLERQFKLEVLDWLSNGEPKLFKSPNEGNYMVRLMNVSLSPTESLGRMLHTFNATAYEVSEVNYSALTSFGIINKEKEKETFFKISTVPLSTHDENYAKASPLNYVLDESSGIYFLSGNLLKTGIIAENGTLVDIQPGTEFIINDNSVVIGGSKEYEIPVSISSISLPAPQKSTGLFTYGYISEVNNSFNQVLGTDIREVLGHQKVGKFDNVIDEIENVERSIVTFYDIRAYQRPIDDVEYQQDFVALKPGTATRENYKDYYILDEELGFITPSKYSYSATHYKKVYNLLYGDNKTVLASFDMIGKHKPENTFIKDIDNNLLVYKYTCDKDPLIGELFVKVIFSDVSKQDTQFDWNRDLKNRTSSNPYLFDYRDFELMTKAGRLYTYSKGAFSQVPEEEKSLNPEHIYFIKENIEYIFVAETPNVFYLTVDSYNKFTELWILQKQIDNTSTPSLEEQNFKDFYKKYNSIIFINSEGVDLSQSQYLCTGPIGEVNSIQTEIGVYCELYYQIQIRDYDVSSLYNLQVLKLQLQDYRNKLTKDYMIEQCINSNNTDNYIKTLEIILANYNVLYDRYIIELTAFLNSLDEERYS